MMEAEEIYKLWEKVLQCEMTLKESGIPYEVTNSVGYGAQVHVQIHLQLNRSILIIPRYIYDEMYGDDGCDNVPMKYEDRWFTHWIGEGPEDMA